MGNPEKMFCLSSTGVSSALRQGEVLSNVVELQIVLDSITGMADRSTYEADAIEHPFVIIVSQDCDLDQDFNFRFRNIGSQRHELPGVLFCQAMQAKEFVRNPRHSSIFKSRTNLGHFKNNSDFRFHFMQEIPAKLDALKQGLPELAIEFKRYFSLPTGEVYHRIKLDHTQRRCGLKSPYLEHFCDRFHYFNNRIALPEQYESK